MPINRNEKITEAQRIKGVGLSPGSPSPANVSKALPAVHDHESPAQGGTLDASAIASGTLNAARLPITLSHGTYTPSLTNVANLDGVTAYACQWMRVGNTVTVSGFLDANPTSVDVMCQIGISLPVASNFAFSQQCAGTAFGVAIREGAVIFGDQTNDRAHMQWLATDLSNQTRAFHFTYQII